MMAGQLQCIYTLSLITVLITVLSFARRRRNGPQGLPIIGHLHLVRPLLHQSLHKLSKSHGDLIHIQLCAHGSVVVASSPDMAKEILNPSSHFASRPDLLGPEYIQGSPGIVFAPPGIDHDFMRRCCLEEFFSTRKLGEFMDIRQEEIRSFMGSLFERSETGERVNMKVALTALTNNIICRIAMSTRCSGSRNEAEECQKLVEELVEWSGKLNIVKVLGSWRFLDLFLYGKKLKDASQRFMSMMDRIINQHEESTQREDGRKDDLLDVMLRISQKDIPNVRLSKDRIKAFFLDIFIAGSDTSSTVMQWALAELINHPHVFKRAREEIESVVNKDRLANESDIPRLPYITAVVKETLRLHPAAPVILRESTKDCNIGGYDIPEKTKAFVNVWGIGRDPRYYENPLEFCPERFLINDTVDVDGQHFQLKPFGSGRRSCPGKRLAMLVIQTTIAALIQCFDWKCDESMGQNSKIDMKESVGFTLQMATPLYCTPTTHCNPLASSAQATSSGDP